MRPARHQHMPVTSLVRFLRSRLQQIAKIHRLDNVQRHRIIQPGRAANRRHPHLAHSIAIRRQRMRHLQCSECHRVVRSRKLALASAGIARHPGRNIHRNNASERKARIDLANQLQRPSPCAAAKPGPQQRIHHNGGVPHRAGDLIGRLHANHMNLPRREPHPQLPRNHQPVAAVVSLAAQHHDSMLAKRREPLRHKFHHTRRGILHQRRP